jgi:hypothetical protein
VTREWDRPGLGTCTVASCQRLAARLGSGLCGAHDGAWRLAGRPELAAFRRTAAPCLGDRSGRVVLAGFDEGVIAEVLYGVQEALAEGQAGNAHDPAARGRAPAPVRR